MFDDTCILWHVSADAMSHASVYRSMYCHMHRCIIAHTVVGNIALLPNRMRIVVASTPPPHRADVAEPDRWQRRGGVIGPQQGIDTTGLQH